MLLFLFYLRHSAHKSNIDGMLMLSFPVLRDLPQNLDISAAVIENITDSCSPPPLYSTSRPHSNPLQYALTSASSDDVRPIWLTLFVLLRTGCSLQWEGKRHSLLLPLTTGKLISVPDWECQAGVLLASLHIAIIPYIQSIPLELSGVRNPEQSRRETVSPLYCLYMKHFCQINFFPWQQNITQCLWLQRGLHK